MSNLIKTFHKLHTVSDLLILPNAWDAGSARLFEAVGAKAIATTSGGVAWALGYPDGNALPAQLLAILTGRITDVIRVPLSVDVEGAYTNEPNDVAENLKPIIDAGAAGINIEDGEGTPELLVLKIEQVRKAAESLGVELFINARTDVYLNGIETPKSRVAETLSRAGPLSRRWRGRNFHSGSLRERGDQNHRLGNKDASQCNGLARPSVGE
jgi:2-methylisocitrate lyase-like PEP mutase family enzyme